MSKDSFHDVELDDAKSDKVIQEDEDPSDKDPTGRNQRKCDYCWWPSLRWYFRHPYLRAFIAIFITFCNFLIYAEDPIAHSRFQAEVPIIGDDLSMIFNRYPGADNRGVEAVKVLMMLGFVFLGMFVGRQIVHHKLFRDKLKMKMFAENKGTWFTMFFTTILILYIGTRIYNGIISSMDADSKYQIDSTFGLSNEDFMKVAASGTWMGDYLTAYMVIDMMLQDVEYPNAFVWVRSWYKGHIRVFMFWFLSLSLCCIVISFIAADVVNWDSLDSDLFTTTELSRAALASVITLFDLMIVMQDWEFPTFVTNQDINLPGLYTFEFKFDFLKKYIEFLSIHVTGKWFNYGIITVVMMLDLNMMKNQLVYAPADFGQYTDPNDRVWTITNAEDLANFKIAPQNFTWDKRMGCCGDFIMKAKFKNFSSATLGVALIPCLFGFVLFYFLYQLERPERSSHEVPSTDAQVSPEQLTSLNELAKKSPQEDDDSGDDTDLEVVAET